LFALMWAAAMNSVGVSAATGVRRARGTWHGEFRQWQPEIGVLATATVGQLGATTIREVPGGQVGLFRRLPTRTAITMRHRVRIQPYVSRELQQKLRSWAATQNITESAVAEAALTEFLDGGRPDKDLISRRLDVLTRAVAQLQDDHDVTSTAFGRFVRHLFLGATTAAGQDKEQRAEAAYQTFLRGVLDQRQTSVPFATQVRRARAAVTPPTFAAPAKRQR
jgi:hypothetical protein